MEHQHIIENAVFDLAFGSEEAALEQQAGLGDFVKNRLMPVVDRVFDEMSATDRVYRIDRLDIDLGSVAYPGYHEELEIRLEEKLRTALTEKLGSMGTQPAPGDAAIPREQGELEQLEHFLLRGRLPWNAGLGPDWTIDQLLQRVIRSNGSSLAEFLRSSPGSQVAIRRMARQFPEATLAEIAGSVAPFQASFLGGLMADFRRLWRGSPFAATTEQEFGVLLWERLFSELLGTGGSSADRRELIDRVLSGLPDPSGRSPSSGSTSSGSTSSGSTSSGSPLIGNSNNRARAALAARASALPAGALVTPELVRLIQAMRGESARGTREAGAEIPREPETLATDQFLTDPVPTDPASVKSGRETRAPAGAGGTGADEERIWTRRLAEALLSGNPREIAAIWPALLRERPVLLKEGFQRYGRPARIRRRIAESFPESMLRDLAGLFQPSAASFIADCIDEAVREAAREAVRRAEPRPSSAGQPAGQAYRLKPRLWEFALGYLLAQGGDRFSKRDFAERLLRRLAAAGPMEYRDLLISSVREPEPARGPGVDSGELYGIIEDLEDLASEAGAGPKASGESVSGAPVSPSGAEGSPADSRSLVHSYDLYHRLRRAIIGEIPRREGDSAGLTALIDELAEKHPRELLRLYRELQAGEIAPARVAAALSGAEAGRLVQAFLSLTRSSEDEGPSPLMQAVATYAGAAQDPREFYRQVLECLVQDRIIDFDAILAAGQTPAEDDSPVSAVKAAEPSATLRQAVEQLPPTGKEPIAATPAGQPPEIKPGDTGTPEPAASAQRAGEPPLATGEDASAATPSSHPPEGGPQDTRDGDPAPGAPVSPSGAEVSPADQRNRESLPPTGADTSTEPPDGRSPQDTPGDTRPPELSAVARQAGEPFLPTREDASADAAAPASHSSGSRPGDARTRDPAAGVPVPPSGTEGSPADSRSLIHSYELYHQLRRIIIGEIPRREGDSARLTALIDELAEQHPRELLRLYRELQAGEIAPAQVAAALSGAEAGRLVQAFLSLTRSSEEEGPSALMQAVATYAGAAQAPREFYRQVLECLVQDRIIDFEAILAAGQTPAEAAAPGYSSETGQPSATLLRHGEPNPPTREDATADTSAPASQPPEIRPGDIAAGDPTAGAPAPPSGAESFPEDSRNWESPAPTGAEPATETPAGHSPGSRPEDARTGDLASGATAPPSGTAGSPADSRSLVHSYELYNQLRRIIVGEIPRREGDSARLTALIDELTEQHPRELLRLYRELQAGEIATAQVAAALSGAEAGRLVQAFLSLTRTDEAEGPSALMQAVTAYAGAARDPREFYRQVLECLIEDRIIDFEAILAAAQTPDETAGFGPAGRAGETAAAPQQAGAALPPTGEDASATTPGGPLAEIRPGDAGTPEPAASAQRAGEPPSATEEDTSATTPPSHLPESRDDDAGASEPAASARRDGGPLPPTEKDVGASAATPASQPSEIRPGDAGTGDLAPTAPASSSGAEVSPADNRNRESLSPTGADASAEPPAGRSPEDTPGDTRTPELSAVARQAGEPFLPTREDADADAVAPAGHPPEDTPGDTRTGDPSAGAPAPPSGAAGSPADSRSLVHSYELYNQLRRVIIGEIPRREGDSAGLTAIIDELTEQHPRELLRLYRELQAGEIASARVAAALSGAEAGLLVQAFLSLTRTDEAEGPSALMQAVTAYAGAARDPREFYRQVLECLVQDRIIDFEAILAAVQTPAEADSPVSAVEAAEPSATLRRHGEPTPPTRDDANAAAAASQPPESGPGDAGATEPSATAQLAGEPPSAIGEDTSAATPSSHPPEGGLQDTRDGDPAPGAPVSPSGAEVSPADSRNWESLSTARSDAAAETPSGRPNRQGPTPPPSPEAGPDALVGYLPGYLKEGGPVSAENAARLIETLERLLARQPARLRRMLEPLLETSDAIDRIIDLLPERLLTRTLLLLRPVEHYRTQRCADILADAFRDSCQAHGLGVAPRQVFRLKWQFIFRYLLEEGLPFHEATFVGRFADFMAEATSQADQATFRAILSQQVALNILPATREQHLSVIRALTRNSGGTRAPGEAAAAARPAPAPGSPWLDSSRFDDGAMEVEDDRDITEDIYIANAGQVLASPYIQRLFDLLELLEGSAFKDRRAAERAAHLLQFMVDESVDTPEYQLVLNKILCGVPVGRPIEREIEITDREREVIDGLIQGMIHNWRTIGNTSVAGFRESFLQREGRLRLQDDAWHLLVEPRAFDMLLDSLPWSFSTIRHPWMERVLYVEWR